MSTGHHHAGHNKPIDAEHSRELERMLANPQFAAAVAAYRNEDDSHDIPYLGGSDIAGTTIFYDRQFVAAIEAGQVKINGQPIDPRKTLKVHESIEGAEIRLLKFDYTKAHDIATIAEHHAVDHLGWNWAAYSAALEPYIRTDERETITNPPPNLLLDAYKGTKLFGRLATFQLKAQQQQSARPPFHPSMIGARQAPDGHHYLPDRKRPGKYLRVVPNARGLQPGLQPRPG